MKLVLGGGLGGLSAAYYLGRRGAQVYLVEKSNRLGGWVRTEVDPSTGVILESGPHTVRPAGVAGRNTLTLLKELGQRPEDLVIIKRNHPAATRRLICLGTNLHPLPSSLASIFKSSPPFTKPLILSFIKDMLTPRKKTDDETAYDFIERRFGRELAEYAISPMLCGICAGDAKEISIKSLMPIVFEAEQNYGSVIRGFALGSLNAPKLSDVPEFPDVGSWSVWTHKKGLFSLIEALRTSVTHQGGSIHLSSNVSNLKLDKNSVQCDIDGSKYEFNHLVSSLPSKSIAKLLNVQHPELSRLLLEIQFATVIVVNLVFKGDLLKEKAFGFLVPPSQNKSLLGIIYDSCIYPQGDNSVFTAMLGGRWFDKYFSNATTEDEIKDITLSYFKSILGIEDEPVTCRVSTLKDCIPQYTLGHSDRVNKIFDYIKQHDLPLSLVGSSFKGIGVNDVILNSKNAVNEMFSHS